MKKLIPLLMLVAACNGPMYPTGPSSEPVRYVPRPGEEMANAATRAKAQADQATNMVNREATNAAAARARSGHYSQTYGNYEARSNRVVVAPGYFGGGTVANCNCAQMGDRAAWGIGQNGPTYDVCLEACRASSHGAAYGY